MKEKFEIKFLEEAAVFLEAIDIKASGKLFFNIESAKLTNEFIWEFRAESKRLLYRLLAFWDKRNNQHTLIICTHGFIKKTDKVAKKELFKAHYIMNQYLKKHE